MNKFIPIAVPLLNGNEKQYVNECLDSTWISSKGKFIDLFENEFASFCDTKYGLSCSNGTVALHLPLIAYNLQAEDEVIVPTLTYIATANAVKYCGATPVFVDCEEDTWNMDPLKIEEKITEKTKGIIVVHLYGNPVDMDPIMEIAKKYNLFVIEDAAEAHGAIYKGRKVGSIGHVGVFSLFGNKIITTGEGGMVVTNDKQLADKMRLLKGQGMDPERRYWFSVIGYNYRMTNIQAAIGLAQIENIDNHIQNRKRVSEWYKKFIKEMDLNINIQTDCKDSTNVFWMFSVLLKENSRVTRDELMGKLLEDGIETRPVFYPLHQMPPYFEDTMAYKNSDKIAQSGLNLPSHGLLTEEDVEYICSCIKKYI